MQAALKNYQFFGFGKIIASAIHPLLTFTSIFEKNVTYSVSDLKEWNAIYHTQNLVHQTVNFCICKKHTATKTNRFFV